MVTLAQYHPVIGEKKNSKIYLSGPVSYREFRETGSCSYTLAENLNCRKF